MSEIKVNSIKGVGASTAAITVNNTDGTCTANITNNLSNRRLTINGAMTISQRATSSTVDGYGTIDRFRSNLAGCDENPTQSQSDVASGTTPYTLGFRKAFKFTNGNQTSGAGTTDCVAILHRIEAQDIANSGWNYTDSNSKITLSFWCKSSVAQNFFGFFRTQDGTAQLNAFETGSLTADTWTKVTKTITGDSNLQFDSNNDTGLDIEFTMFRGTDRTGTLTLNQWAAYNTNVRVPDMTSTWYTTNDATWELTGVQLEVGSVATDFEHRSFNQELDLCYRYYQRYNADGNTNRYLCGGSMDNDGNVGQMYMILHKPMRANIASIDTTGSASDYAMRRDSTVTCTSVPALYSTTTFSCYLGFTATSVGWSTAQALVAVLKSSSSYIGFSAEL